MCDQQNLRSACAYAQSDQSLCLLLEYSMSVQLLTEHLLEVLSLKKEAAHARLTLHLSKCHILCWISHVAAQMYLYQTRISMTATDLNYVVWLCQWQKLYPDFANHGCKADLFVLWLSTRTYMSLSKCIFGLLAWRL